MNELYYHGDTIDMLNHKTIQIPGGASQTTFKKSVKRLDVEEEGMGMFEEIIQSKLY